MSCPATLSEPEDGAANVTFSKNGEHDSVPFESVLKLDKLEEGLRQENFSHDTEDREDHTFCGIMVDVICTSSLPCEYVEVNSVWVRGDLGPMTVYTSEKSYHGCMDDETAWVVRHKGTYESSFHALVELQLDPPLRVPSGKRAGLYIHSTRPDDQAVVYDNMHHSRYANDEDEDLEDETTAVENGCVSNGRKRRKPALSLSLGQAALSDIPFGGHAPWGAGPWRRQREFVGRVSYGVRWMLWTPELHRRFPLGFRAAAEAMLMGAKRPESPLYCLREEVIFYILNRCGWDWFGHETELNQQEEEQDKLPPHPAFRLFGGREQAARVFNGDPQALLHLLHMLGMQPVHLNGDGEIVLGADALDDEDDEDEYEPDGTDESSEDDAGSEESTDESEVEDCDDGRCNFDQAHDEDEKSSP